MTGQAHSAQEFADAMNTLLRVPRLYYVPSSIDEANACTF
jgi:hypothetical protein